MSQTPRRPLPRQSVGTGVTPPTALRKPSGSPPLPRQSFDHDDHKRIGTPSSSRTALPRPSLSGRKSVSNLRASIGPSSATTPRAPTADVTNLRASMPGPSTPASARTSFSLVKTPLTSSHASAPRNNTPTPTVRSSRASARFESGNLEIAPPVPSLDSRYTRQTHVSGAKYRLRLSKDDLGAVMQISEGEENGFRGILRFLGEIHGKGDVVFAGLELIDEWQGKGKNDGTVGSIQYFATMPKSGIFLLPSRLTRVPQTVSDDDPARPQSAMSGRSSQVSDAPPSEADVFNGTPTTTPAKRRGSIAPPHGNRPGSVASIRTSSRTSLGPRPESSLGSSTNHRTPMRAVPRKSMFEEMREDSEAQKRSQASAENIAAAQGRITAGSRAAELMKLTAKDLAARKQLPASAKATPSSPARQNPGNSPLKNALTDRTRAGRASLGTTDSGAGVVADMLPPNLHRPTTPSSRSRPASNLSTHDRASSSLSHRNDLSVSGRAPSPTSLSRARSAALLAQMDLDATPRRNNFDLTTNSSTRSASRASEVSDGCVEGIAEAVVPLTLYEEASTNLSKKEAELSALKKSHFQQMTELDRERKKLRENAEVHLKLMEEEREMERQDERRRRSEIEAREKQINLELDIVKKENKKLMEEAARKDSEANSKILELETRLSDSDALIDELKRAVAAPSKASEGHSAELMAKDAELEQMGRRLARVETQFESERRELTHEIEELKDAGQETITLYELRLQEAHEESRLRIEDVENRMHILQARAQEALATVEGQREEAIAQLNASGVPSNAASIDIQSLQEQLGHAKAKVQNLEDQLLETQSALQAEVDSARKRRGKHSDSDAKLKTEIQKLTTDLEHAQLQAKEAKDKAEALHEALEERSATLEAERSELESLRAEAGQATGAIVQQISEDSVGDLAADDIAVQRMTSLEESLQAAKESIRVLTKRLEVSETERKETAAISAREVADLEALVEAGMWQREELEAKTADLEKKLRRAKEKVAAAKASNAISLKQGGDDQALGKLDSLSVEKGGVSETALSNLPLSKGMEVTNEEDVCDDCGSKEHTLDNCPLLDEIF